MSNYDPDSYQSVSIRPSGSDRRMVTSSLGFNAVQVLPRDSGAINDRPVDTTSGNHVRSSAVQRFGGGQVSSSGAISVSASDLGRKDGVFETARNSMGNAISRQNLKPSDTIDVGGMRTTVESAVYAGLMAQDHTGAYFFTDGSSPQSFQPQQTQQQQQSNQQRQRIDLNDNPQQQQEVAPTKAADPTLNPEENQFVVAVQNAREQGLDVMDDKAELAFHKITKDTPPPIFNSAMEKAIQGGLEAVNWNDVAIQSGITPEEARSRGAIAREMLVGKANAITKESGISNPNEFYTWLATKSPENFEKAQRELFTSRKSDTLKAAIQTYLTRVTPTEADWKASGYETKKSGGAVLVKVDGTWMSSEAIVKGGYLKSY